MLVTAVGSIKSFLGRCLATATATPDEGNVCTTPDFISTAKLTSIDIGAVTRYIANAGLSRKLRGFVPADTGGKPSTDVSVVASFNAVSSFLCSLLTTQDDGRVLFKPPSTDSAGVTRPPVLKFCLLNPGALFEPIVTHSRSVVLVGGTLQPMSGLLYQLFPSVLPSRTHTLACAHVVPPDNVLTVCLSVGPSGGTPFDFSFGTRDSIPQLTDLAAAIGNILMLSPIKAGVVCFFPSYELEAKAWLEWNASGSSERITGKARVCVGPCVCVFL